MASESTYSVDVDIAIWEHRDDGNKVRTGGFMGPIKWPYKNLGIEEVVGIEMLLAELVQNLTNMGVQKAAQKKGDMLLPPKK